MLTTIDARGLRDQALRDALPRATDPGADVRSAVSAIIDRVRRQGDRALRSLTMELDGVDVEDVRVPASSVRGALDRVPADLRAALELAHRNIVSYHSHETRPPGDFVRGSLRVRHLVRPVARAGCYAPGGRARYPSTVLMCAGAARVAGVPSVALCVPPGPDGRVDDATLAAAAVAKVDEVYAVGGAQAVAAMACGTESIRPVDVIAGPGNRYVAEAKRQLSGSVGVAAAFAGPSEVVVVVGPGTPAEFAAVDLAVQAEHGPDGLAWLVTWSGSKAAEVVAHLERVVAGSPRRADLESTLATGGFVCLVDDLPHAIDVANVIAPEHLEIMVEDAEDHLDAVQAAGAVFCGPWAPATLGDYVAGPNHVLPTDRTARFASSLRADDFRHHVHAVSADRRALEALAPSVAVLATTEGLPAHRASVEVRLAAIDAERSSG